MSAPILWQNYKRHGASNHSKIDVLFKLSILLTQSVLYSWGSYFDANFSSNVLENIWLIKNNRRKLSFWQQIYNFWCVIRYHSWHEAWNKNISYSFLLK